jgi:biotin carboxyl carrier protein
MKINGELYETQVLEFNVMSAKILVNEVEYVVEFEDELILPKIQTIPVDQINLDDTPSTKPDTVSPPTLPPVKEEKPVKQEKVTPPSVSTNSIEKDIKAPLPGTIMDIKVKIGDKVTINQSVAILEAMKMESEIFSDIDGEVTDIFVAKGASVSEGKALLRIRS